MCIGDNTIILRNDDNIVFLLVISNNYFLCIKEFGILWLLLDTEIVRRHLKILFVGRVHSVCCI